MDCVNASAEPFFRFDAEEDLTIKTSSSTCASFEWEWGAAKGDHGKLRDPQSAISPYTSTPVRKTPRATAGADCDDTHINKLPSSLASFRARAATGNLDWLNMETDDDHASDWNLPPPCLHATFSALRQHARDARFGTERPPLCCSLKRSAVGSHAESLTTRAHWHSS